MTYSPDEWEAFVHEWVHYCLTKEYQSVARYTGAGDMGLDVVGFTDDQELAGIWDNFQCKHYDHALTPSDVWPEFGKILWHSFNKEYTAPRHYYFVAPWGAGTKLNLLLGNQTKLRSELVQVWDKNIKGSITTKQVVPLTGSFASYVDNFNLSIFSAKTSLQLIEAHRSSHVHTARFGGGLPPRPASVKPPAKLHLSEIGYVKQLLSAYSEHSGTPVPTPASVPAGKLRDHFHRQREYFYEAESLRVFARDNVPNGTFEGLQNDIYSGVIDTHDAPHVDGYHKVCTVTKAARDLHITANALITCTNPADRDGICHQLVNDERLYWKK